MKISVTRESVSSSTTMTGRCRATGKTGGVSTDTVMVDIFNHLISDFQRNGRTDLNRFRIKCVKDARSHVFPCAHAASVEILKQNYQLQKFFSRYTAKDDLYSPIEVRNNTESSFHDDNNRVAKLRTLDGPLTTPVLSLARKKARQILGKFSEEEVFGQCQFGRRASIGVPLLESYLENKARFPISCTAELEKTMVVALSRDPFLVRAMNASSDKDDDAFVFSESLAVSLVPKKYDKLRPITPYTTSSVFLSLGVGRVMAGRLARAGLDITSLQAKHRRLIKKMSISGSHVTADMKAASTSITWQHVFRILPMDWARHLRKYQVKNLILGTGRRKREFRTETFVGMGCGFTFPLQMLIFYCLLWAIDELVCPPRRKYISVYGDDLIYPVEIHRQVCYIFDKIGFVINTDKTFASGFFRESCGEDCFRGVPVRPFSYEGETQVLSGSALCSFLYKIINGLLSRLRECDITRVVYYLKTLLALHSKQGLFLVPSSFPETSGLRVASPSNYEDWFYPVSLPQWHTIATNEHGDVGTFKYWSNFDRKPVNHIGFWSFRVIQDVSERRPVEVQYPYIWNTLRVSGQGEFVWDPYAILEDSMTLKWAQLHIRKKGKIVKSTMKAYVALKKSTRAKVVRVEVPIDWDFSVRPAPRSCDRVYAYDRFRVWPTGE